MPRYAFNSRIKSGSIEEDEREHPRFLRVDDLEKPWDEPDRDPVNRRSQVFMSRLNSWLGAAKQ
jgi:hypothetical protein